MSRTAMALECIDLHLVSNDKGMLQLAASYEGMSLAPLSERLLLMLLVRLLNAMSG